MIVSPQGFNSSIQVSGERSDIDNNIIVQYQCISVTAILEVTNSQVCNIDIGNVNTVPLLDLKKAFDTVDHILLSKLHLICGISGVTHKCFSSFFYIIILRQVLSMVPVQKLCCTPAQVWYSPRNNIRASTVFAILPNINDLSNCLSHSET